jgi:RNA polymerase sigma factor (TIGR02999 family)
MSEATRILDRVQKGDPQAGEELLPLVYEELRKLAAARLAEEPSGQTLQPTALVHEAWLRLVGDGEHGWNGRGHFFGAAAEAMRRILVENARRKQRVKHGGGQRRVELNDLDLAHTTGDEQLLAVDEALERFAALDPVGAKLVKLRFFVGLSNVEASDLLGLPERTAKRSWAYARAWLHEELKKTL